MRRLPQDFYDVAILRIGLLLHFHAATFGEATDEALCAVAVFDDADFIIAIGIVQDIGGGCCQFRNEDFDDGFP